MNLFENIFNTVKSWVSSYNEYMGNLWSQTYDATHNTVDPTQNIQNKILQWGADIYTWIKTWLQKSAQLDIADKQKKADDEGMQFAQHLASKGYNKDQIFTALDWLKKEGKLTYTPNFAERLVGWLGNRMEEVQKTTERLWKEWLNLKTAITAPVSYAGDVVWTAFEPVSAALSPVVQKVIEKTGQTGNVQEIGKWWEWIRQSNPNFADAIEGSLNLASLTPVPFAKPVSGAIEQWVKTTGNALVKGAEYVAPKVVQWVRKITPTLPKAQELLVNQLEKTNRMNPTKYTEFEQMAWERAGKFMADRKITGDVESNVSKLYDNFTKSKVEADKWLSAIQKTYKPSEVPPSYVDMLWELEKRFTYTKDNTNLAKVQEFKSKLGNGTLSHNDINGTKRLYEQKVKVNYIKDQNSLEVERATNIDNDVRNWQFDEASKLGFDNLKQINKETQLNRYLADAIGDKLARQLGNNNISLTDWIIAGQVPATPQALALLAGKKIAQNVVPKLYQKSLEKIAKLPTKKAPVANIENISKMETIRKSVNPQYDPNRLLVSPRNSSRTPTIITPDVTLPTGEKWKQTIKSPAIKSDITSKSIIRENWKLIQWKPKKKKPIVKPKKITK